MTALSLTCRGFALLLLALSGLLVAWPGHAGVLWRCTGTHGETVFSTSRGGYSQCRRMSYPAARHTEAHVTPAGGPVAAAGAGGSVAAAAAAQPLVAELQPDQVTTLPPLRRHARILRGSVYRVTLADGTVEYTNVRPVGITVKRVDMLFTYISTCFACSAHSSIDWATTPLRVHAYAPEIAAAASRYGVDPALLRAVIHAESAFDPRAVSDKGAQGLMQLMPGTAADMGVRDAFLPGQNIDGGARYLAQLLRDFHGNERLATAAYNAGEAAVRKYNGVPPYDETQLYVQRVALLHRRYRAAIEPALAQGG
ncbi:MAG TPA: lytic transglycosylase domain-containing protein [Rhodanobacteraceae bacterium]|nr:lytic transglycosylase domain-containing protein [Rhodanobacteraceae bacterium]